ncbi:HAD family hydrolase [Mangrovicoccus algicola]|uniref:HAD family phosphatase n=1 Tax=Mangrovicoccus algicola TaxID=2771008 RepID=A0A8J7CG84_9RHOB|nr:HAD family phosphatase [Mangrovicoccus algicola]MBE3636870.1 HAD family phosphatase [Mangrovicoccus algicola]
MKAILWDMDGTLIDSEPLHEHALVEALRSLGIEPDPRLHDKVLGMSADKVYEWLCAEAGLSLPFGDWIRIKYSHYMQGVDLLKPMPGALECWRAAAARGLGQAVASNSDRIIVEANLGHMDLIAPGMVTVSRNDVREGKPAPEIYQRAAWLLGVDPSEAVVLEDSRTGALAGLAAGMQVLIVPYSEVAPPEGARKLADMAELKAMIAAA